ncbi:hypothetical protein [Methylobacterium sp. WL8]|uniref:hypothetical protein n=1 Tax=Methylobacterium sp. WL8 TaxID=2603899 RepID=UPI0011CC3842|nr:hypothetical protein [Methylobacterium sp. WL8]TXN75482.1 hypothetical protein FV234_25000 [Methylobacterium sp. WL8]
MPSTHDRLIAAVRAIEARAVRYSSEMTAGGSQTLAIAAALTRRAGASPQTVGNIQRTQA